MNEVSPKYSLCEFGWSLSTTKVGRSTHKGCKVVQADNPITKCRFQLGTILCVCAPMDQCTDPSVALCGWSGLFGFRVLVPSELPLLFSVLEGNPQWLPALKFICYTHICLSYNIICGNYDIIYKGHDCTSRFH